jgi:DDE superfamily endonuclease
VSELHKEQREELTHWAQSRTLPAGDVFRARLMLALAEGKSWSQHRRYRRGCYPRQRSAPPMAAHTGLAAKRHGFEYYRHSALSRYGTLDVRTGKVVGKTAPRHTSAGVIDFLADVIAAAKWASEIHIVLDNLSAHKTKAVDEFLQANPKVRFHFTPTSILSHK